MKMKQGLLCAALVAFGGEGMAAVSADEANQLGGPILTWNGAEKAGNKEGTIPAYTGEGLKAAAGFNSDPKDPYKRPDPFASEKPLFTITAQNAGQYADKLDGVMEMFKRYPNFRMDVYPTHRTATFPKYVIDNTIKNATACKSNDDDLRLEGCWGGYAFPIPKSGAQIMWNHLTAHRGHAWGGGSTSWVIANDGSATMAAGNEFWEQSNFFNPKATAPASGKTLYWQIRTNDLAPARRVGQKLIVLDPLDIYTLGRRAFQYIPGQRRVKLAPDLAYDTPSPYGGGALTMDDNNVFMGALDRYDWKLVGKKEKYIMYNNFKLLDHRVCVDTVINTKSFANPDCVRWELHRVWVVEAKLKPGFRHIYSRRMFYFDEDTYAAGLAENYDASGKIYRVITSIAFPFWSTENGGFSAEGTFNYDLATGVWTSQGSWASPGNGEIKQVAHDDVFFSPESLAGEGVR